MPFGLVLDNTRIVFESPGKEFIEALDKRTAFRIPGAHFSDAFKNGYWDGREHLVKKAAGQAGWYEAPIGLMDDVLKVARVHGTEFTTYDRRRTPSTSIDVGWNSDFEMRPYQKDAVAAVLEDRGLCTGKGLLNIATRGGKTVIAARIIYELKVKTLFLVQSEMLMRQTVALFENVLGVKVGIIGKGVWDPGPVTVASVQTLTRNTASDEYIELLNSYDLVFFDEVHHAQGERWREVLMSLDSYYKIGLSATIFLSKKTEVPKGTIWIRAAVGPIVYKIDPSTLIEQGYLVAPEIVLNRVTGPEVTGLLAYHDIYEAGIIRHEPRNLRIAARAKLRHDQGMQVVVTVRELVHVEILATLMEGLGLRVGVIIGPTPAPEREKIVKAFEVRKLDVLVGTVFGEAVDIPIIESVIVADGGKSQIAATQRFRNLTPSPGKERAVLDDFMDLHHYKLAEHASERLKTYVAHGAFRVVVDPEEVC